MALSITIKTLDGSWRHTFSTMKELSQFLRVNKETVRKRLNRNNYTVIDSKGCIYEVLNLADVLSKKQPTASKSDQICWLCKKATNSGCNWSKSFQPVDGWKAIPAETSSGSATYKIIYCPEFEEG